MGADLLLVCQDFFFICLPLILNKDPEGLKLNASTPNASIFSFDSSHKKLIRFPIPMRESATLHDEMVSIGILQIIMKYKMSSRILPSHDLTES
jgi:hypothetical protein